MSDHAAPDAPDVGDTIADGISNAVPSRISEHLAMGEIVESVLEELKQNGYTIAPAGDVLTAEDRAAIGRLCKLHMADTVYASAVVSKRTTSEEQDASWELMNKARKAFTAEDFKRLRAIAAGGTA